MVNINNVYQTVLVITNKDNRGYITPDEFNRLAEQAQNEIFASYFAKQASYELNAFVDSDFSDPTTYLAEKINVFYKSGDLTLSNGVFTYPSDLYRVGVISVNNKVADRASHEEIKYINLSPLTYPVATQPVYTLGDTGVTVYPDTVPCSNSLIPLAAVKLIGEKLIPCVPVYSLGLQSSPTCLPKSDPVND